MGEVVRLRTPSGGTSAIKAELSGPNVVLKFERELGDGVVMAESIVGMAAKHARALAMEILRITDGVA